MILETLIATILFVAFIAVTKATRRRNRLKASSSAKYDFEPLKRGFSSKVVEGEEYDVVVIGSGISGLTNASLLAQAHKRVLVLEQHDVIGGNMHTFEAGGYEFDTGIHYVGEVGNDKQPLRKMLSKVSNDRPVQWAPMDDHFDVAAVFDDKRVTESFGIHKDVAVLEAELIKEFPEEAAAITKYLKMVADINMKSRLLFVTAFFPPVVSNVLLLLWRLLFPEAVKAVDTTSEEIMNGLTKNKRLQGILCYMYGNGGLKPSQMSFLHHCAIVHHYIGGGYYPVGGSRQIYEPIVRQILALNGTVLVRAPVSEVLVSEDGEAEGVVVKGVTIRAKTVISTAGAFNTYLKLVPKDRSHFVSGQVSLLEKVVPTTSFCSLFVGINNKEGGTPLNLPKQNVWAFPSWEHERNNAQEESSFDAPLPGAFISFPSTKDPTYSKRFPGRECAVLVGMTQYKYYSAYRDCRVKNRGAEYDAIKKVLQDRLLDCVYKVAPQIRGFVDYVDCGTPVTNDYYLGTLIGECYGMAHNSTRFRSFGLVGPCTPIKGLFLSGHDVFTNGFAGAIFGGYASAMAVLYQNSLENMFIIGEYLLDLI